MLFKHQSLEGRDFLTAFLVLKPIELRNPLSRGTQVLTWRREVLYIALLNISFYKMFGVVFYFSPSIAYKRVF
jgi:hypothetical protein